ncbi:PTS fructose transporter subunit IIABC [Nocardia fluminea]|uniref:PTS system D-fructose-specific IIA component (F1P-forming) (Frc family) /PTS system D-fructose-specific IIB component (F1P-forming) (Frc family) /PTS system D-fructose-specific IIC component (F1P-f... n=1 Tax=Nocardia fluminea TaxID=134984 RepID=A0A2N3VES2_9NOCA|nr:fructose-specific PTS transporter subunit EIIC [Nocardia fluminea]PKV80154.1 PTS system D-fructose-specific IIA component (F1P-forming) (Frc family) /PTS system D-fructose-specific IIB component (F1P-forming) (Frc family) /PTS system D-fructose-specific IIC component (F1P-forming) (Frc family) [Nocardia fluminea]
MADSIITPDLIALDADLGAGKGEVITALAGELAAAGRATDAAAVAEAALTRESQSATGLPGGIAIPHCRSAAVTTASLAFARLAPAVDFGAPDGPADLVFLIAAPEGAGAEHMKLLSSLARALVRPAFVADLRAAATPADVVALVDGVINPPPAATAPSSGASPGGTAAGSAGPAGSGSIADPGTGTSSAPDATATAESAPATSEPSTAGAGAAVVGTTASGVTASSAATTGASAAPACDDSSASAEDDASAVSTAKSAAPKKIVAVTACPTGIAHTYMAADSLVAAGERAGVAVAVETQGSSGGDKLDPSTIADADAVIFATDVGVKDRGRFAGKPVIESGVKRAINEPDTMIAEAVAASTAAGAATVGGTAPAPSQAAAKGIGWGTRLRQILLTGVSYMIPFVAAGGLLIALSFLLGGYEISDSAKTIVLDNSITDLPDGGLATYFGAVLFQIGSLAFSFLVPALAGYIAFAIADRPGLAPGFTAGAIAVFVGAGFLGGLVGGLVAGFAALWVSKLPVPTWARGLMPVVVIPLLASAIVGMLMFVLLGKPLAAVTNGLTDWLSGLSGTSAIALGVILGVMMCFDLGGPVNKAAYAFAAAGLSVTDTATLRIMAAVMAAGMVPPLAMALSTVLRPRLYTEAERENGKAAWLLGASFISEGAIPFAAADPLRVLPSMMVGGAVTGGLIMATDVTLSAPHGGIFVFFAIGHLAWFVVSLVAGTLVAAACVTLAKELTRKQPVAPVLTTA